MDTDIIHTLSPADLVASLDPEAIATRLADLDREARALRVLLRAARARHPQRSQSRDTQAQRGQEATHAS